MRTRAERRAADREAKRRVRFIMGKVWGSYGAERLDARRVGKEAARHLCTGRHRWCGCTARSLRQMGYVTRQEMRAREEDR